ncbi:Predicted oxidoreductase [Spirosomataceae bacterium TFI 002]|nr:Predicted oxidoreductase [Spirosomataceae bacterium TFI 002]
MKYNTQIGLGTAAIGRPHYINIKQYESEPFNLAEFKKSGIKVLDAAFELGIKYYDTAPGYGVAEEIINNWKASKEIEIATKWGYTYTAAFDINAEKHEIKEHSLQKLEEQWQVSQHLLPQLSIYQIHSASFESEVLLNQAVLNKLWSLKSEHNLIIGLSTTGIDQVAVIEKALEIKYDGVELFDAFQVTYNMLDQSLSQLIGLDKRIIVKEALANGRVFRNKYFQHYNALYNSLEKIGQKYSVGIDAVALRFCMDSVKPHIVLSGAATKDQLRENLMANDFKLSGDEIEELKSFKQKPTAYWNERKKLNWN